MIIDLKEYTEQTYEVQKQFKSICDVCGKETENVVVCCSSFGPFSISVCKDCLTLGRDSYNAMVAYISCAGHFPEDINEEYQKEVRRQLTLHNISEERFIADVNKAIEDDFYG